MPVGEVKWFDAKKGFGFIVREGQSDLFLHFSAIQKEGFKTVKQVDKVSYDVVTTDKGEQVQNVVVVEEKKPKSRG